MISSACCLNDLTISWHVHLRTETYRGMSHVEIRDGDVDSTRPWKTTNQVFSESTAVQHTVGLANAGVSSDVAIRTHKKQGIYKQ